MYSPLTGGGEVQRTLKFVKYLPEFGWRSVVLTTRKTTVSHVDGTLEYEIPSDTVIHRTKLLEVPRFYSALIKNIGSDSNNAPAAVGNSILAKISII